MDVSISIIISSNFSSAAEQRTYVSIGVNIKCVVSRSKKKFEAASFCLPRLVSLPLKPITIGTDFGSIVFCF